MTEPTHIGNDPSASFIDWSKRLPSQVEGYDIEAVAASDMGDEDKKFLIFRIEAIQARRRWETTHPRSEPFAGVYLAVQVPGGD